MTIKEQIEAIQKEMNEWMLVGNVPIEVVRQWRNDLDKIRLAQP